MADSAVETISGIVSSAGGSTEAKTLIPALVDLGTLIGGGGGGTIEDGSITTDKIADGAITASKMDGTFLSSIYDYADMSSEAVILATDATSAQVLMTYGVTAAIVAPDDFDVSNANLTNLVDPQTRLCWINGTDLEVAGVHIDGDMVGQTITMVAKGNTSTISGVLGVDTAWTITANSSGGGSQTSWYGTCSTSAAITVKDVVCAGFELKDGERIRVHFINNYQNTSALSLNVNNTGSIWVKVNTTATQSSSNPLLWGSNTDLSFTYHVESGSAYWMLDDGPTIIYGTSSSTADSTTKSMVDYGHVMNGTLAIVQFANANTNAEAIKLNVNSTFGASIYVNGTATSSTNPFLWDAGDTITFVRKGAAWHVVSKFHAS